VEVVFAVRFILARFIERALMTGTNILKLFALAGILSAAMCDPAKAAVAYVNQFGDHGWRSDDTRDASGNNLVGITSTNAGRPGQVPTAADDAAIAAQIQFVAGPAGSTYGGAVSIDGTSSNSGKSNISVINDTTGFASGASLLSTFSARYEWYGMPNPTSRTLAFKLGIQSTSWGTGVGESQNGFVATRSGESVWDLVLVHVPALSDNTWSTVNVDHDSGTWSLFRQAGNGFFTEAIPAAQTLDAWNADPTWGPRLFGDGALVSSVQFGLGSSQRQSIAFVDYLQTNLLNGGDLINFTAGPEPNAIALIGLAATAVAGWGRRRK
jgi:hypothetical protein